MRNARKYELHENFYIYNYNVVYFTNRNLCTDFMLERVNIATGLHISLCAPGRSIAFFLSSSNLQLDVHKTGCTIDFRAVDVHPRIQN